MYPNNLEKQVRKVIRTSVVWDNKTFQYMKSTLFNIIVHIFCTPFISVQLSHIHNETRTMRSPISIRPPVASQSLSPISIHPQVASQSRSPINTCIMTGLTACEPCLCIMMTPFCIYPEVSTKKQVSCISNHWAPGNIQDVSKQSGKSGTKGDTY